MNQSKLKSKLTQIKILLEECLSMTNFEPLDNKNSGKKIKSGKKNKKR